MLESTITSKGQTTLPKQVRQALKIEPGDRVRFVIIDRQVRIIKATPVAALEGLLARPGKAAVTIEEMEDAIAAGAQGAGGAGGLGARGAGDGELET